MNKTLNINGSNKEIEFIEVIKETGTLKMFFTDKTFVMVEDIEIIIDR